MDNSLINLGIVHSAPKLGTSEKRRVAEWGKMTNENLKFAFDVLSLHHSPFEVDCANEIQKRIMAGVWLNVNNSPPPSYTINFRGFLPYLGVILAVLAGVVLVGRWLIGG